MSIVIETTLGDITVDLFVKERPKTCLNFLKLCRLKYYNFNLFHTVEQGFIAQTGDPSGTGDEGMSVWGVIEGSHKQLFEAEYVPKIRHTVPGLLSMVSTGKNMVGSQFFFTLGTDLLSLDGIHCVIGEITEGHEILRKINESICGDSHRPYQDIRITHTVVLEDPFENPRGFREPSRSPSPTPERLKNGRIAADEEIDDTEGKTEAEVHEMLQEREAKARATILEIVGDLPDAEMAPPENVLFVCKLNPVTTDDDLNIIFGRFGLIKTCEVIRDKITGDSLQYAFVEFEEKKSCEDAYFKMDNVLIDDRRIHVDFSQSVAKIKWSGKGRIEYEDESDNGRRIDFSKNNRKIAKDNNWKSRTDLPVGNRRDDRDRMQRGNERNRDQRIFDERKTEKRDNHRYNNPRQDRYRERSPLPERRRSPINKPREKSPPYNSQNKSPGRRRNSPVNKSRNRSPIRQNKSRNKSPENRRRSPLRQPRNEFSETRGKSPVNQPRSRIPMPESRQKSPIHKQRNRSPLPYSHERRRGSPPGKSRARSPVAEKRQKSPHEKKHRSPSPTKLHRKRSSDREKQVYRKNEDSNKSSRSKPDKRKQNPTKVSVSTKSSSKKHSKSATKKKKRSKSSSSSSSSESSSSASSSTSSSSTSSTTS